MILIVEGPDAAGKTTLIEAMAKAFPAIVIKNTGRPIDNSAPERQRIKDIYMRVMEFVGPNSKNGMFILDRFFLSELVYSKKRGYEAMEDPWFTWFEKYVSQYPHLLIVCDPGAQVITDRINSRGDDYVTLEENLDMRQRYLGVYESMELDKMLVDTSQETAITINQIKQKIDEHSGHNSERV